MDVIVSVLMITYNHEAFISQAIEGVLMQKTSFQIELIIGEDFSTDNTRKICQEYQKIYPDRIKLLLPGTNLGMMQNFKSTLEASVGKYIALCEGDDYWTDPLKLQKQVEFLEDNLDYSFSFHKVKVISEGVEHLLLYEHLEEREYKCEEVYNKWSIPTCSVVFRRPKEMIKFPKVVIFGDSYLFLSLLELGKTYCHNFEGAVYRRNIGSISAQNNLDLSKKLFYQYKYMVKRFPKYREISIRNMNDWLDGLIYAPFFKGIWKYRFYKMLFKPRLFFSGFLTTTLTSYLFKRNRQKM